MVCGINIGHSNFPSFNHNSHNKIMMWLLHVGDTVQHESQSTNIPLDERLAQKMTAAVTTQKECYTRLNEDQYSKPHCTYTECCKHISYAVNLQELRARILSTIQFSFS